MIDSLGDILHFNTLIVLLGTGLLGMVSGLIGSFAVLRGRALMGDALAHAALPGLCIAFLIVGRLHFGWSLVGAVASGVIGVLVVTLLRHSTRIKDDAAIGIVLSVTFGLGIALSRIAQQSPEGNQAGLDNFLYGQAASMVKADVITIGVIGLFVLVASLFLYKEFTLLSFDRGFAAVQGWPTVLLDVTMMGLLVVTTVVGLPAVGVVLMSALLIIPGAAARFWTERLSTMLVLAVVFGGLCGAVGTLISATYGNLPTGPVIVLCGASVFVVSMLFAPRRGVAAGIIAHVRTRRRVAWQNLLRSLYEYSEEALGGRAAVIMMDEIVAWRAWSARHAKRLVDRAVRAGILERESSHSFRLTDAGLAAAADVVRTHRLWEMFLISEADIAADHVDRDADEIEHFLPADLIGRLEAKLVAAGRWPRSAQVPPSPHELSSSTAGGAA